MGVAVQAIGNPSPPGDRVTVTGLHFRTRSPRV
jgi:hypothetical protein